MVDKEELLREAKRRYPIGSIIDQSTAYNSGSIRTIRNYNDSICNNYTFTIGGVGVYCVETNKWVEIISETINDFPVFN